LGRGGRNGITLFFLCDSISGSPMKIEFYLSDKNNYILKASDTIFLKIYSMISDTLLPFTGTVEMIS